MTNIYKVILEDDNFEIIEADTDKEAIEEATRLYEFFWNIEKLDNEYDYIETIY